ncbi:MAG: hypothetical protein AB9921_06120 [Erysipelotrichaceae bacterium]
MKKTETLFLLKQVRLIAEDFSSKQGMSDKDVNLSLGKLLCLRDILKTIDSKIGIVPLVVAITEFYECYTNFDKFRSYPIALKQLNTKVNDAIARQFD